jgi:hypothetical protein
MPAHARQPVSSRSAPSPQPEPPLEAVPDNSWLQEQLRSSGSEAPPSDLCGLRLLATAPRAPLPHPELLSALFGDEDEDFEVHVGDPVTRAALRDLGASALAADGVVAFADPDPSREQVAHELAHLGQGLGGQGLTAASGGAEQQAQQAARAAVGGQEPGALAPTGAAAARDPDEVSSARDTAQLQALLNRAFVGRDLAAARSLRASLRAAREQSRTGQAGPAVYRRVAVGERVFWVDDPSLSALEGEAERIETALAPPVQAPAPQAPAPQTPSPGPGSPPERYGRLGQDVIDLLYRSRDRLFPRAPGLDLWAQLDTLSPAQLRTLNAVLEGARANGLRRAIGVVTEIYEYGSSYGIHYLPAADPRPIVQGGSWCLDDPQSTVRSEHGNTAHEWWRHGSGGGQPGMHSGLDIGAGYHNLHWDTTNPSTGRGGYDVETTMGNLGGAYGGPTSAPRPEVCSYGAGPLVDHARDIGWGPFSGDPLSATRNQPSPFHEIEVLQHAARFARQLATSYPEVQQRAPGFPDVARQLTTSAGEVEALRERSRELASASAPAQGSDPRAAERAALAREHQQIEQRLFFALAAFYRWLLVIVPNEAGVGTFSEVSGWSRQTDRIEEARGVYRRARERMNDPMRMPRDAGV